MKSPFRGFNRQSNPSESRVLPDFKANAEMDSLLPKYREISALGTAISLDGDGLSDERIASYNTQMDGLLDQYGDQLIEYLTPYENLPSEEMQHRGGIDFERWFTIRGLLQYKEWRAQNSKNPKE